MLRRPDLHNAWAMPEGLTSVEATVTSGTSGTFQQTNTAQLGLLHRLCCSIPLKLLAGNGSSVTATSGEYWPADTPYYFVPGHGQDALGWASADGSTAINNSTEFLTVCIVSSARSKYRS